MSLGLSAEQTAIGEAIRQFVENECPRDTARALEAQSAFPGELVKRLAALGFYGLNVPEEFGGTGPDLLGTALVISELARLAPVLAAAFSAGALRGGRVIAEWGSPVQQQELLPRLASGEALVTFAAEREDEQAIRVTGDASGSYLNGLARHVALADQAETLITLAHGEAGWTAFVVPSRSPGLSISPVDKVGTRGVSLCRVQYGQVAVSREQVLGGAGQIGRGAEQWEGIRALEGIETAALCLGISEGALEYASAYARERVQFGKAIVSFEAVQHLLVEMNVDVRAARSMLYEACSRADHGGAWHLEAAMARLKGLTVARQAALQSLHILGGYGYMREYDAQRYVRDALSLVDGSESVELLKNEIGSLLGLGARPARAQ